MKSKLSSKHAEILEGIALIALFMFVGAILALVGVAINRYGPGAKRVDAHPLSPAESRAVIEAVSTLPALDIAERPGIPIASWDAKLWASLDLPTRRSIAAGYWIGMYTLARARSGGLSNDDAASYMDSIVDAYSGDALEEYVSSLLRSRGGSVLEAFLAAGWLASGGI